MATRQQIINWCKVNGCAFVDMGDRMEVVLPHGKRFDGGDCHYTFAPVGLGASKAAAYDIIMGDLAEAVVDCEDPECDDCHPEKALQEGETLDPDLPYAEISDMVHPDEVVYAPEGWRERHRAKRAYSPAKIREAGK